ncbi:hypothetical protein LCGC14_1412520, partial [marine sediment metagenome]
NYISQVNRTKIYEYTQIELLTDLVFGHVFDYNFTDISNEQDIGGVIGNFFGTTNVWDIIAQFYSPLERQWIPLATDSATILSDGTYSITWDINRDPNFYLTMDDFSYEYLPLQVVPPSNLDLWGSWGIFLNKEIWQPIIVSEINGNLDITLYEFDNETGWEINASLSSEMIIPSISDQTFKLFDINNDNNFEIIRLSASQIDVIYLDASSGWVIVENITALSDFEYFLFDIAYDESSLITLLVVVQTDTSDELSIWKYQFESDYLLTQLENCYAPINFIPTSIKILSSFSNTNSKSILVGGRIKNSYYSQLIEYDFNLNVKNILVDLILGEIIVIEYSIFDTAYTIILGVERVSIGKMDAVIALRKKSGTEEWIEMELSGFDDTRFEILDLLTIQDNNMKKLIIASKTGLFETKITNIKDTTTIVSPIAFTFEVFSTQELLPENYPTITLEKTPIYAIYEISYILIGSSQWQLLSSEKYRHSRTEVRLDLLSIYSNLQYLRIAYSFESFESKERTAVDPSFQSYAGTPDIQNPIVSGTFFDDTSLPFLWLNPTTATTDPNPDWNILPNGMTYQSTPVISGLGTEAFYPTVRSGWENNLWGTEYTTMPELENSLIYYDDTYDSGILAEQLNGKEYSRTDLIEDEFDGRFEGNYIDGVWYSDPYVSNNYDFPKMYDSDIHDNSVDGYYDYYNIGLGNSQYTLLENTLTDVNLISTESSTLSGRYSAVNVPSNIQPIETFNNIDIDEFKNTLNNWNEYLTSFETTAGKNPGLEFTYKFSAAMGLNSLIQINIDFDASMISAENDHPLSILIKNYNTGGWEALPVAPVSDGAYNIDSTWSAFWSQGGSYSTSNPFIPAWISNPNGNYIETVSFGNTFQYTSPSAKINLDTPTIANGGNFLINNLGNAQLYRRDAEHGLIMYSGPDSRTMFDLKSIEIDPDNFYTSISPNYFPILDNDILNQFELRTDFNNYMNDNGEFTFRVLSDTKSASDDTYLSVGMFKTYTLANTQYLNYDNFELSSFSEHIDVTSAGLELKGDSGIRMASTGGVVQEEPNLKTLISPYPYLFDSVIKIGENILNAPIETNEEDGIYWVVGSVQENYDYKTEIDFKIEIPKDEIEGVKSFEIQMNAISPLQSYTQYFEIYNFTSKKGVPIIPTVNGNFLTFDITSSDDCEDDSMYKVWLTFNASSSTPFDISIDMIQMFAHGEWLMSHGVYRAAFTFDKFGGTASDSVVFSLFNDVSFNVYDLSDSEHWVEFYYNFTSKKLSAYLDDVPTDLVNRADYDFGDIFDPKPGIESRFADKNYGILLLKIESQYYKRVSNNRDFEEYKSLLSYHNSIQPYVDQVDLSQAEIGTNPLFTYLSAEIDVIYSFNDEMTPENIFDTNFNPAFTTSLGDNLESVA